MTRDEFSAPAFGATSPTCRLQSEVPSSSDLERHSVAVQETEQWVGLCLVPVRFRTYDEQLKALTQVPVHRRIRYRSRGRYFSASILIGIEVPEEWQRQVPTNQIIQRTVERTQVRVHRDMYRSSRSSRRLLRHHKLSRENAVHPEDPEDC